MSCYGGNFCQCPVGPMWPADEVEAARVRVLKRRIERRVLMLRRIRMRRRLP